MKKIKLIKLVLKRTPAITGNASNFGKTFRTLSNTSCEKSNTQDIINMVKFNMSI